MSYRNCNPNKMEFPRQHKKLDQQSIPADFRNLLGNTSKNAEHCRLRLFSISMSCSHLSLSD